uniref:Uncharacterized protein n=1 Tax=Astyanax mexicanus TaxID=7994 RepID=A0A8B9HH67_ASTMX
MRSACLSHRKTRTIYQWNFSPPMIIFVFTCIALFCSVLSSLLLRNWITLKIIHCLSAKQPQTIKLSAILMGDSVFLGLKAPPPLHSKYFCLILP